MPDLQTSDPCLRAEALRRALDRLLSGEAVAETELAAGNGSRRRLVYHKADVPALRQELATAERECRALGGDRSRARVVKFSTSKGL